MENVDDSRDNSKKFELETKIGSVWGNNEDKQQLKEKIIEKKTADLDNSKYTLLNGILSSSVMIIAVIVLIYLNKKGIWFF